MKTYCIVAKSEKTGDDLLSCRETKIRAKARLAEYERHFGKYTILWEGIIHRVI